MVIGYPRFYVKGKGPAQRDGFGGLLGRREWRLARWYGLG